MKIKRLEVCGFKSFVDRTVLTFDHDVTCVVGPNGCGKSNVVDAIRWVMGEQSAKQLRGKAMEDVIFNGAESRGPHSYAEVSVTFDNTDGLTPAEYRDYAEITVTRRLDRMGHSDYFINKTPVRLMDVTNLFLGTGVGRRAYSIIEQGRIGLIVSAKPEDRRHLIEEAAGITKFKAKKRSAERKMDQTRQNLLRVSDIIQEIEKTLSSLKRQAQKAERYKQYRTEIRDLELWVAAIRWLELSGRHRVLVDQIEHSDAHAQGVRAALHVREAEVEAERLALQEKELHVDEAQTRSFELDNAVQLLETQIGHHMEQLSTLRDREAGAARELEAIGAQRQELAAESDTMGSRLEGLEETERQEAEVLERENALLEERRRSAHDAEQSLRGARERVSEADTRIARADAVLSSYEARREEGRERLERLRHDRVRYEQRIDELGREASELAARLEGLRNSQEQLAERKDELEQEMQSIRERLRGSEAEVERLRAELGAKRSRLRSLEEVQQRFEGVGAGVRALMQRFEGDTQAMGDAGLRGLVADHIECPVEWTRALAGALGESLEYVVVDSLEAGVDAVRFLQQSEKGRATLMPRAPRRTAEHARDAMADREAAANMEGVAGYLSDLVRVREGSEALAEHLLGGVLVVDDLDVARRLHERGASAELLVTRQGEAVAADGRLIGGHGDGAGEHMLQLKREMRELHEEVAGLDAQLGEAVQRHAELRDRMAQRQAELEGARTDAHDKEIAIVKADRDLKRAEDAAGEARASVDSVGEEIGRLEHALDQAGDEEKAAREEREASEQAKQHAEEAVAAADEVYASRREEAEQQNAVVTEVRVRAAQARQQVEGDRSALERLLRSISELDERAERLHEDIGGFAYKQGELAAHVMANRESLGERMDQAVAARDVVSKARAAYDEGRERLGVQEAALRELRSGIDEATQTLNELALQEREVGMELEHLTSQVEERHRVDVRHVLPDYHSRGIPGEAAHRRIEELHRIVQRMGEINLTAIEEYEERSERYEYLTGQRTDLETALEQLEKAIRQMNRESRRLFRETFDAVNERFQRMFPRMFGGGKGALRLTNPEDLLESGIDIVAMPPGKKLGSIELMSGGEKALTAVSLIFAIFQHRPSPFCLLDEVDAPLDEANIGRFCDMIREMTEHSQFILITHSKRTMEMADVLYGVTMETPGISKLVSVEMRGEDNQPVTTDGATVAVA